MRRDRLPLAGRAKDSYISRNSIHKASQEMIPLINFIVYVIGLYIWIIIAAGALIIAITNPAAAQSTGYNYGTTPSWSWAQPAQPTYRSRSNQTYGFQPTQPGSFNSYGSQWTGTGQATGNNWQQDSYGNWYGTGSQNTGRSCVIDSYGRYVCY